MRTAQIIQIYLLINTNRIHHELFRTVLSSDLAFEVARGCFCFVVIRPRCLLDVYRIRKRRAETPADDASLKPRAG